MEEIKSEVNGTAATVESDAVWKSHIEYAKDFLESDGEYCRRNGLSLSTFKKYKLKYCVVKPRRQRRQQKAFFHVEPEAIRRIDPVQAPQSQKKTLPDAKWAAEFVIALMSRL